MTPHATTERHEGARAGKARAPLVYLVLAMILMLLLSSVPYAQEPTSADEPATATGLISLGDEAEAMDEAGLGNERAKAAIEIEKIIVNDQELNGSVSDNVAINTTNGGNTISGDAFGNASGFVNSIQNTGNNVLIQSATIVNVSIED